MELARRLSVGKARSLVTVVIAGAALAGLSACGEDDSGSSAAGGDSSVKGKEVVLVTCSDANPFCKIRNQALIDDLTKAGVKVTYLGDPFDPALAAQHMQQAIARQPDLIVVGPTDTKAVVPAIIKADNAGIPVVHLDLPPDPRAVPHIESLIHPDSASLGKYAAQNLIEGLRKEKKKTANVIAITGTTGQSNVGVRMEGFNKEMAKAPEYKVVAVEDGGWDQTKTQNIARQLFARFANRGGIQGAYGMADQQAAGIITAAEEAGLKLGVDNDGLVVTGSNCLKAGIDNIEKGLQYGTATQVPSLEGRFYAKNVLRQLRGDTLPKEIRMPEERVTSANLDKWGTPCSET